MHLWNEMTGPYGGLAGPWSSASACFWIASAWLTCCRYRLLLSSSQEPQALHTAGLSLCSMSVLLPKTLTRILLSLLRGECLLSGASSETLFLTTSHVTFPHSWFLSQDPTGSLQSTCHTSYLVCVFPRGPWILSAGVHVSSTLEPLPSVGPFV